MNGETVDAWKSYSYPCPMWIGTHQRRAFMIVSIRTAIIPHVQDAVPRRDLFIIASILVLGPFFPKQVTPASFDPTDGACSLQKMG